ncbi:hypothetical protein F5051DRAFT_184280 [Lentinula edodes]|nr:hypothetical protein F5051DRAFT_184280 [Lentinula edodes]
MLELKEQVPEVPLDWYFKYILPPLPGGIDTKKIVASLKKSKAIKNNSWADIPEHPRDDSRHEDDVYAGLENVFERIVDAAKTQIPGLEQKFALKLSPHAKATSERDSTTMPDGHFTSMDEAVRLSRSGEEPSLYQVWNSHEFKKGNERVRDIMNQCASQVVYDMQQIMALDPCRRFTFGTSIMNRSFRLWFCSRGAFFTAEPFDFISEPEKLVHVFLAFAFASRTDAGWDPSMSFILPASPTEKRQYRIRVGDKTYITVKMLSDHAADSPIGRGTRVWLVIDEAGPPDCYYVLKDVWVDNGRETEDEIRSNLLKDVELKCGSDACATVKKHLLTPIAFEKLLIGTNVDDTSQVIMRRGSLPKTLRHLKLFVPQQSRSTTRSQVSTRQNPVDAVFSWTSARYLPVGDPVQNGPQVTSRYHYRIVFQEYATTMYDEKNLGNALRALADVTDALRWIHKSQWVHRDISSGNVYWYDCGAVGLQGSNRGLLGDLEFAKVRKPASTHEVRTGTFNFMASEVITGRYLFLPAEDSYGGPEQIPTSSIDQPPFAFNPLHDIESIWWILVYLLYFNDDKEHIADLELATARTQKALVLFTQILDRAMFLQTSRQLTVEGTSLSPSFRFVINTLRAIAIKLHTAFRDSEAKISVIEETAFDIHEYVVQALRLPCNNPQVNSIELVGVSRPQKRKIDEAESGHEDSSNKRTKK